MRFAVAPLALVAAAALAIVPACGFPTLNYEDDGGTSSGGMSDAASHADGGEDAGLDGSSPPDGEPGDAASDVIAAADSPTEDARSQDAAAMPDAACIKPCDCDNDGYMAVSCGGKDCCDIDKSANPGVSATTWFTKMPDQCGSWDYNCDGKVEEEVPITLTCGGLGATGCTGGTGFMGDPGCGMLGPLYQCDPNGALACKPGFMSNQTQGCH